MFHSFTTRASLGVMSSAKHTKHLPFLVTTYHGNKILALINNAETDSFTHTAIECEPLPVIANGMILYSDTGPPNYALGTVATYSCDTGFVLDLTSDGSMMRTCGDDGDNDALGEFSGTAPSCVRKSVLLVIHGSIQKLKLLVNGHISFWMITNIYVHLYFYTLY